MGNEWASGIISGIVSGFVVTGLLFLLKLWLRPSIKISPHWVYWEREIDGIKEKVYQLKFINKTFFNIENISIDIYLMSDYYSGEKKNYRSKPIKSFNNKFLKGRRKQNKELQDNCVVLTVKEEEYRIFKELKANDWIHLQIISYHSLSGFRKAKVAKFTDVSSCIVKNKKFKSGEHFELSDA